MGNRLKLPGRIASNWLLIAMGRRKPWCSMTQGAPRLAQGAAHWLIKFLYTRLRFDGSKEPG